MYSKIQDVQSPIKPSISDETARLQAVVLGTAESVGPAPALDQVYDPSSRKHLLEGTYPKEEAMVAEMEGFASLLKSYEVQVYRPEVLKDCNQIFARDIGFVVGETFFRSNILPLREEEFEALQSLVARIPTEQFQMCPEEVHVEGGDVMPWRDHLFIGTYTQSDYPDQITARTNLAAVNFLNEYFPGREVKAFELRKSTTVPHQNALHLDCCFQPVGNDKAILCPDGFLNPQDADWIRSFFGSENIFEVSAIEMAGMHCNVFSISPEVVVSEKNFTRLNDWLREQGFTVEAINYSEISKQGGLLRCSTLPLLRHAH
jgi:N-dimethylarginine dimethylaminohydrolase